MKILILGSGGREHALYEKLRKEKLEKVYFLPGNAGASQEDLVSVDVENFSQISQFIRQNEIDLVVVGPEKPLAMGIKDYLEKETKASVFGPTQKAAQLEASKVFAYEFMKAHDIPVPESMVAKNFAEAEKIIQNHHLPIVLKADGLAQGKGVSIHFERESAMQKAKDILENKIFSKAGDKLLISEFVKGNEASLFAICNGKEGIFFPVARDYKRLYDGDKGPNTGGMGSFAPADHLTEEQICFAKEKILAPILKEFHYTGILYIGLMVEGRKENDLKVIEFNVRFGDPEAQCLLSYMVGELTPYLLWSVGKLETVPKLKKSHFYTIPSGPGFVLNVVLAAQGYPENPIKGIEIKLPEKIPPAIQILHAGTIYQNEKIVSKGGRVLNILAKSPNLETAQKEVYDFIEKKLSKTLNLSLFHYRKDIGKIYVTSNGISAAG